MQLKKKAKEIERKRRKRNERKQKRKASQVKGLKEMTAHQILTTVIEMQKETKAETDIGNGIQMMIMIGILNQKLREEGMTQHRIAIQTAGTRGNLT